MKQEIPGDRVIRILDSPVDTSHPPLALCNDHVIHTELS